MIRRGGIDSQIEQRKMQFGENPQALQQRYGQSKQLLDLLALQQITEEQKQKSQMMQMQMQQNPATIAEQVEQEALQGKKAEMAQSLQGMQAMRAPKRSQSETARGVAGALAQKQREQQSRMQKIAGSGVAGQRARNMERMYDGGIVGFQAGGYNPTEEEIDAAIAEGIREGTLLRSTPRSKVRDMLIREKELGQTRETIADVFTGIGRRAKRQATRGRPVEEGLSEKEKQERALASAPLLGRAPDPMGDMSVVSDSAVLERIVGGSPVEEEVDVAQPRATATTTAPTTATAAPTDPGLMERKAQQKQEILAAGKDILGSPTVGPLKARRSVGVPDLLRAREEPPAPAPAAPAEPKQPSTRDRLQELLDEQFSLYERQKGELDKEQSIFDILTGAARRVGGQKTNRGAAAAFLGGISEEIAEDKERKKTGLAKLQERLGTNLTSQLALEQGIAQIERGEALTSQGARGLELEAERLGISTRQIENANRQFYDRLGLDYAKMGIDSQKAGRIAEIQEESNRITEEFNQARTKGAKDKLAADYAKMIVELDTTTQEAVRDAIKELEFSTLSDTEKTAEIARIRKAAATELRRQQEVLRRMQKAATGQDMGEFSPTTGAAVSGSGIQVLGVE